MLEPWQLLQSPLAAVLAMLTVSGHLLIEIDTGYAKVWFE
jgi:hypothetical protein